MQEAQRLAVELSGLSLKNPITAASGACGYGREATKKYNLDHLGSFVLEFTTLHPRQGNPRPRVYETNASWPNADGLQNVDIIAATNERIPWLRENYPQLPIIANAAGFSEDEYIKVVSEFASTARVKAIELNVSCPNVKHGGMTMGTDPKVLQRLVKQVIKAALGIPIYVKPTPNVTNIVPLAQAAEEGGASGLTMISTLTGLNIDLKIRRPALANIADGLSGPAIKPLALRMIHQVRQVFSLSIIGVDGIESAEGVLGFMMAGASTVQIGVASFRDPLAYPKIATGLPVVMDRYGIKKPTGLWEVRL